MVVGGGGIVCCEKRKIWGCLCIAAFVVLNGARGTRAATRGGGWSPRVRLDTPRVIYRARRVRLEPTRVPIDAAERRSAQLRPPHAPGATPRCPAKGHAVDLERVGKGRRAPMSTPSGILNRISASLIVSSRSITLVY